MKSKVILFSILLFCSKIVDSIPHSEDLLRQRVYPLSKWQVDQNAEDSQDAQYLDFTQTRNINPPTIPAIPQDSTQDYYPNKERYNYDDYEYNKSPVASPLEKKLLGNYNTQVDRRRLESNPPRVESYSSRVGFDSQQFRNPYWRSQNQYSNYPSNGVLITDSKIPLVNTVQEPYRGPVQYLQPKYVPSSNPGFSQPKRSYLRREPFQYSLADNAGDGKHVANSVHRVGSNGQIPYENLRDGQAEASEIKARLIGDRRHTQSIPASQSGIIYKEPPVFISTDTLEHQRKDRLRSDLSNTAQITNYDDGSPAISSLDNYSLGSRTKNIRAPNEIYAEAQAAASEVKPIPTGSRRYVYNNVPDVIATDILADQSKTIKYEKRENYKSRSDPSNIAPITNQEHSSPVISVTDNTDSEPSNPTSGNIEKKAPFDRSEILSHKPLAHRYTHNYRPESETSYIARDDSNNGVPTVIPETITKTSGEYEVNYGAKEPFSMNTYSGPYPTFTDTESDVPSPGSSSSILSNAHLDHKPSSGITEFSLVNLLSKTDIEKLLTGNTERFLVIHPNKTVEYVDNIGTDLHQNLKLRLVNPQLENPGMQLPENFKDNPVQETDSKLPIEDLPDNHSSMKPLRRQQADSTSLKPLTPLSKTLTPLVNQAGGDDTPYMPLNYPENQPEEIQYSKPLRPNKRHPVHHYKPEDAFLENNSGDDNISSPSAPDQNEPEDNSTSKPLRPFEKQPTDDSKPTAPPSSQTQIANAYIRLKSTTSSPIVSSTTPNSEETSGSQIIEQPIEQVTDNVIDVSPVSTPTTVPEPIGELDTIEDVNNEQDDNSVKSSSGHLDSISDTVHSSTTTEPPSSSTTPTDNTSGELDTIEDVNNEQDDNSVKSSSGHLDSISDTVHSSTTIEPPSSPTTPTDNTSDESDTIEDVSNEQDDNSVKSSSGHLDSIPDTVHSSTTIEPPSSSTTPTDNTSGEFDTIEDVNNEQDDNSVKSSSGHLDSISDTVHSSTIIEPHSSSTTPTDNTSGESDTIEDVNNEQDDNSVKSSSGHLDSVSDTVHSSTTIAPPSSSTAPTDNTSGESNTIEDDNNEQDDNSVKSSSGHLDSISDTVYSSTTIEPPSSSTTPTDNTSADKKAKETVENSIIKTNDNSIEIQRGKGKNDIQTGDDNISNSSASDENEPEDNTTSKPLRLYEKQPTDDSKSTALVGSKVDENPDSTTVSPTTPTYITSSKAQIAKTQSHSLKTTTRSPIYSSTTTSLEETSEDETTIEDGNNEQDDNSVKSSSGNLDIISDKVHSSTTTASPSSSTTPTDNTSGVKITKDIVENNNIETNDKAVESQRGIGKNDIQTVQSAVYSLSELLDTNTGVPAECDVYSPVTTLPSVQNDVNTGDASGDNTLELEKAETDVTITISSNIDNDSEDDFITINIEVSESAGSSDDDESFLISIDTDDHSDDEFETSLTTAVEGQSSDCKKDHNVDDGTGNNIEIDMSNIQGEPTMWIRTTNQDFIEKLTDKNDTAFDVVYFLNMVTQPVIEREKETTFYCNGTVVVTIKETTYPNKDDSTPNIEKTVQTMQIEDYKRYGLD